MYAADAIKSFSRKQLLLSKIKRVKLLVRPVKKKIERKNHFSTLMFVQTSQDGLITGRHMSGDTIKINIISCVAKIRVHCNVHWPARAML